MSELQIGLLIIGLIIVGCVIAFNWIQERQFHQRAEQGFKRPNADLLLDPGANQRSSEELAERIDPHLEPQFDESDATPAPAPEEKAAALPKAVAEEVSELETSIGYVAEIRTGDVVPTATVDVLTRMLSDIGRRYQLSGYDFQTKKWESISDSGSSYTSIRVFLQLVDRTGAVTRDELQALNALMQEQAGAISGVAELPDIDSVLSRASVLDEFCVDVDVIVGLSVTARAGQVLHGTQLRALAEASGLELEANGVFVMRDEQGDALFTMDNQESVPFRTEHLKEMVTNGITFLLDVPRTADGLNVFNKMVAVSRHFADSLDGMLCDDNRVMLNDTGLEKIRNKLRSIYESMDKRGISAGSSAARHLFS